MTTKKASKIRRTVCGAGAVIVFFTTFGIIDSISRGTMAFGLGKWLVLGGVALFALFVLCCQDGRS